MGEVFGYELVAQALKNEGADTMFFIMGGPMPIAIYPAGGSSRSSQRRMRCGRKRAGAADHA